MNYSAIAKLYPASLPVFLLFVILLTAPLGASLWLDEAITAWIAQSSLLDAFNRPAEFQGQSPLYFLVLWGWAALFGASEFALRVPSVFGVVGSAAIVWWLGRRWLNDAVAVAAVMLLLAFTPVLIALCSARPYALALFFSLLFVAFSIKWIETGGWRWMFPAVLSLVTAGYLHYFFIGVIGPVFVYLLACHKSAKPRLYSVVFALLLFCTFFAPGFLHLAVLATHGAGISFLSKPTPLSILQAIAPVVLIVPVLMAFALAALTPGESLQKITLREPRSRMVMVWWLVGPPLVFAFVSLRGNFSVFTERYFLFYAPAVALLFATPLMALPRGKLHRALLVLFSVFVVFQVDRRWQVEDWRGAAEVVRRFDPSGKTPVLIYSGLREASNLDYYVADRSVQYLSTPLLYYKLPSPPLPVPPLLSDHNSLGRAIGERMAENDTVLWVGAAKVIDGESVPKRWAKSLTEHGFLSQRELVSGGEVVVICGSKDERGCDGAA